MSQVSGSGSGRKSGQVGTRQKSVRSTQVQVEFQVQVLRLVCGPESGFSRPDSGPPPSGKVNFGEVAESHQDWVKTQCFPGVYQFS